MLDGSSHVARERSVAGAILDRVPVDQAATPGVGDDAAKPLVVADRVFETEPGTRHELVEELAQRKREAERLILVYDPVSVFDQGKRRRLEPGMLESFLHDLASWSSQILKRRFARRIDQGAMRGLCRAGFTVGVLLQKAPSSR